MTHNDYIYIHLSYKLHVLHTGVLEVFRPQSSYLFLPDSLTYNYLQNDYFLLSCMSPLSFYQRTPRPIPTETSTILQLVPLIILQSISQNRYLILISGFCLLRIYLGVAKKLAAASSLDT